MTIAPQDQIAFSAMNDADWAWEFLRRNSDYKRDYRLSRACLLRVTKHISGADFVRIRRLCPYANKWGLLYMSNPDLSPDQTQIAWLVDAIDWSVKTQTRAAKPPDNHIDLDIRSARFDRALIVVGVEQQNLYLRTGSHSACLQITGDSILFNPVHMRFCIDGIDQIRKAILVLEVARAATKKNIKIAQKPVPYVTQLRRLKYLVAAEKAIEGALLRDIGAAIYGRKRVQKEWKNLDSRAFKDEIARARRMGISLMNGGYRKFLN